MKYQNFKDKLYHFKLRFKQL